MFAITLRFHQYHADSSARKTLGFLGVSGCLVSREHRISVCFEKADRVLSTLQEVNCLLVILSQSSFVFFDEMVSYPLGAGPPGVTEGTHALRLMIVSGMTFQVLGSSIHSSAIELGAGMHLSGYLCVILRVPCAPRVRILSSL